MSLLDEVTERMAAEGWDLDEEGRVRPLLIDTETLSLLATIRATGAPDELYPIPRRTLVGLIDELLIRRRPAPPPDSTILALLTNSWSLAKQAADPLAGPSTGEAQLIEVGDRMLSLLYAIARHTRGPA